METYSYYIEAKLFCNLKEIRALVNWTTEFMRKTTN
jgi:hypothetical protein